MSDPKVHVTGALMDPDGQPVKIGVDYDTVTIRVGASVARLPAPEAEEFASLFVAACWEAAGQRALMAEEDRA